MVVLMPHPLLVLMLTIVVAGSLSGSSSRQGEPPTQVVQISAERFSFTPSQIRTKAGTRLELRLSSDDTSHGFRIVGTDVDIELPKRGRGTVTVTFVVPKAGRYTFECSAFCGAGHDYMRGVIIATE